MTGAVFIDLREAFDTFDHTRLLSKLPAYDLIGTELGCLEIYLFNRKHNVVFHRLRSDVESILVPSWNLNLHSRKYMNPLRLLRLGEKSVFRSQSPAYIGNLEGVVVKTFLACVH